MMNFFGRRRFGVIAFGAAFGLSAIAFGPTPVRAVEVGERAPEFKLASTMGGEISLSDFRNKKWVLLEFYGADFAPTCMANLLARKADHKSFEALGIQLLAASANLTFSQQTFAESMKLPYPLLSDFPGRNAMRSYGVLNEKMMVSSGSFFLIDPQGIVRKKWLTKDWMTTVVYSETLLKDIREIIGKR